MAWSFGTQDQLSIKWALAVCKHLGFVGSRLISAVALMSAESGRYPGAWNENLDDDDELLSTDRGLFQINDRWHPSLTGDNETRTGPAYEVLPNVEYAAEISHRGQHFAAWAAYGSARYLAFVPIVTAVWATGTWRFRVDKVERKFG